MSFNLFRGGSKVSSGELQILTPLINTLKETFQSLNEEYALFVGYSCNERQFDATLIKPNAIINIEIKNYAAFKLVVDNQLNLRRYPQQDKIGEERPESPLTQLSQQNFVLKNFILKNQESLFDSSGSRFLKNIDICGVVALRELGYFDGTNLSSRSTFLKVTDKEKLFSVCMAYSGRDVIDSSQELSLPESFASKLASILNLHQEDSLDANVDFAEEKDLTALKKFMKGISKSSTPTYYVNRINIENELLHQKNNLVLIGAPGSGKSTLVNVMHIYETRRNPSDRFISIISCILHLIGNENILEKLSLEIGISESYCRERLEAGEFRIVFDGVDEMINPRENINKILDFIKKYKSNFYTLCIQREIYNNDSFNDEKKIIVDLKFKEVFLQEFSTEEAKQLIGKWTANEFAPLQKISFEEFKSLLPDLTPLSINMTLEIFKENSHAVYENHGKFIELFFYAKLKHEVKKIKSLGRDSDVLVDLILVDIGNYIFTNNEQYFTKALIFDRIKAKADKVQDIYDLLLRSEILRPVLVTITTGSHQRNDEELEFCHHSYRDYYVAKSLNGKLIDEQLLDSVIQKESKSLVYLCGIESQESIVDLVINKVMDEGNLDLAVECYCNTKNNTIPLRNRLEKALVSKAHGSDFDPIFSYIKRYGDRIAGMVFKSIEEQLVENDSHEKYEWEALKYSSLGIESDEKYRNSFLYKWHTSELSFQANKYSELFHYFSDPKYQNQRGNQICQKLIDDFKNNWFKVAQDDFLSLDERAKIINEIIANDIDDKTFIESLYNKGLLFVSESETYAWSTLSLLLNHEDKASILKYEHEIINYFWSCNIPTIQMRIAHIVAEYVSEAGYENLMIDILDRFVCDILVDINRISILVDTIHTYADFCGGYGDRSIHDYWLKDFQGESYTIFIKSLVIDCLRLEVGERHREKITPYTHHENHKLRNIARRYLDNLPIPN